MHGLELLHFQLQRSSSSHVHSVILLGIYTPLITLTNLRLVIDCQKQHQWVGFYLNYVSLQ